MSTTRQARKKLAEIALWCKEIGVMALAVQQHKRTMKTVEDWLTIDRMGVIGTSFTDNKGGVGFILAPNVVLEETIEHDQKVCGRI